MESVIVQFRKTEFNSADLMFETTIQRVFRISPISTSWKKPRNFGRLQRVIPTSKKDDELDFAERLYSFIFGKEALEDPAPFGLKR